MSQIKPAQFIKVWSINMHFKFTGKEIEINSYDWITFTAPQYIRLTVGENYIEITPTETILHGNVTIEGELFVEETLHAGSVEEG